MRRELTDDGELIAEFDYVERNGNRVLDWVTLHVPVQRAAPLFVKRFPGHRIAIALAGERVVGAILVGDEDRLIFDVFRDPAFPGTGKALIQHALNAGPLTLVVTHGNAAERLYQRLGFLHTYEAYSVDL